MSLSLEGASQISTGRRCDVCYSGIHSIRWYQCCQCCIFDVCRECYTDKLQQGHAKTCNKKGTSPTPTMPILRTIDFDELTSERVENAMFEHRRNKLLKWVEAMTETSAHHSDDEAHVAPSILQSDQDSWLVQRELFLLRQPSSASSSALSSKTRACCDELQGQARKSYVSALERLQLQYLYSSFNRTVKILSLDGGGARGYLTILILQKLREQFQASSGHKKSQFENHFDYIIGTSTGGLLAFCVYAGLTNKQFDQVTQFYREPKSMFQSQLIGAFYNPTPIHETIHTVIKLAAANLCLSDDPTLGQFHDAVNGRLSRQTKYDGGPLTATTTAKPLSLIITSYNCTTSKSEMFHSAYPKYRGIKMSDILKSTMAAPIYFPLYAPSSYKPPGHVMNAHAHDYQMVDGGLVANDPELLGLFVGRRDYRQLCQYRLVSLGTGIQKHTEFPINGNEGVISWLMWPQKGLLVSSFMDANLSTTETISKELARFSNVRRCRINFWYSGGKFDLDSVDFAPALSKIKQTLLSSKDVRVLQKFCESEIISKL